MENTEALTATGHVVGATYRSRENASAPTMQVRLVRSNQRSYFYFPGVSARRAAELAADACAALCMSDVQRMEVFDGPYYGPCGEDEAPALVADWQGMPQLERSSVR